MTGLFKRLSLRKAGCRIKQAPRKKAMERLNANDPSNPKLHGGDGGDICCGICGATYGGYIPQTVEPQAANVVLVPMAEETPAVGGGGSCAGDCCRSFCMTLGLNALLNCLSFVSPLRRLTSRKKQGLRKLKPMRKDTPKLSGGGWLKCAICAGLCYWCCCRSDDENDN
ncbi:hypothetical protein IW147_003069 [Coemansia sp. RSA 720]|nr:hypothetical protein IW147_003069 [Coemansia sp. RSA 720]